MRESSRRDIMAGAGLGLALTASLVLPACSGRSAEEEGGEKEVTANEDLMREHGVLRRILIMYREVAARLNSDPASVNLQPIARAATIFRDFGERYHEQMLEEQHIFPIVQRAGGEGARLVATLLAQHARGRDITRFIIDKTAGGQASQSIATSLAPAMVSFARMYEAHTAREDTVIFPAFKNALDAHALDELGEQFEGIEHREFGQDGFETANASVARIEAELGLADLNGFTAPAPA
jgi:hemerythrin-like domain-containing protein